MAANDSMALGVVKALDAAGKAGQIQVVGFDNIPAVQPLIKEGKMLATVEQYRRRHGGKFGIDFGLRELAGEKLLRLGADPSRARHGGRTALKYVQWTGPAPATARAVAGRSTRRRCT